MMHQKRRGKRVHHQVKLRGSVTLLRYLQMERALADIRSLRRSNFTIRWTCVDVVVDTRRINGEVPKRVEALKRIHCSRVPARAVCKGDLCVADTHRHVVSPRRHLARDFCIFRRDVGRGGCMRLVSSKVDLGGIEYVLHTRTELVFALRRCSNWEKSEEHTRNEISGFPVHFSQSDERWRAT